MAMPTPSINASSVPLTAAEIAAALAPPRKARIPPAAAPAIMEFHGSSFCLSPFRVQSKVEKRPPQTAKLPPRTGARAFMAVTAPRTRSPWKRG
ncbi:hypothetical protein BC937DRAFT_91036 [Endogone sp. FLAS-F59071]|nr:hypothetical protein BC937DRAFT_91036 [Endogone sp. FLAS-F59071]|eukprot:RUS21917.1 hypothetical protein BC937DRAFT_91036 [Endogone sp. FLAS-F59071]